MTSTEPAPSPADDTLREQIAEVLTEMFGGRFGEQSIRYVVNELLPLVQRERESAAAKALADAADDLLETDPHDPVEWLRDRAAGTGRKDHRRG